MNFERIFEDFEERDLTWKESFIMLFKPMKHYVDWDGENFVIIYFKEMNGTIFICDLIELPNL